MRIGKYFPDASYQYISRDFMCRKYGFVTWSFRHPFRTIRGMVCGLIGNLFYNAGDKNNAHHILVVGNKDNKRS
jgi:hypothetical protein